MLTTLAAEKLDARSPSVSCCFQAEDGIRDGHVTGVQTCALPIFESPIRIAVGNREPEIPECQFDIPAEHGKDGNRYQNRGNAKLACGGGQERKLEQEKRKHDVAKIDRGCKSVLEEACEEVEHHHAEHERAADHETIDLRRAVRSPQYVKCKRRQPHHGAVQEVVPLDEFEL